MATMKEASAGKLVRILAAIGEQKEKSNVLRTTRK
jgi:hypothetical protein